MRWEDTQVYIINRNNLERGFRQLMYWLQDIGMQRVTVLDNASTWPPLLDAYANGIGARVIKTNANLGPYALWELAFHLEQDERFIVTDPDVVPDATCPPDLVRVMHEAMDSLPATPCKVGPSLRIDDLPASKQAIWDWEIQFWQQPVVHDTLGITYQALIDTTFALYHPRSVAWPPEGTHYRLGQPYTFRHLPWYETASSPERDHYIATSEEKWTHWTRK